ncbi:MAG: hypothetical protein ACK49X_12045 [Akkermansiaceae bacterium]
MAYRLGRIADPGDSCRFAGAVQRSALGATRCGAFAGQADKKRSSAATLVGVRIPVGGYGYIHFRSG